MTIDLDAITKVLAPSVVGNSFNSDKIKATNSFDAEVNSTANHADAGPNPDSDSSQDGDDAGSPDSETEDAAENDSIETDKKTNFPLARSDDSKIDKNEEENSQSVTKNLVPKPYIDPITKEYVTEFNNFRGRPVYEDDIFDKFKFKITGMR